MLRDFMIAGHDCEACNFACNLCRNNTRQVAREVGNSIISDINKRLVFALYANSHVYPEKYTYRKKVPKNLRRIIKIY